MFIYLIDGGVFGIHVVIAESAYAASTTHPNPNVEWVESGWYWFDSHMQYTLKDWVVPSEVKVTFLGNAAGGIEMKGIIL